jgi:hypothetical protein
MKFKVLIGIALLASVSISFVFFCNQSQPNNPASRNANPAGLAPADNEIPGWVLGNSDICFGQGVAHDSNDLYTLFDGPGVPFVHNGFVNGILQAYLDTTTYNTGDTVPICLQVFNQSTHANAVAIYKEEGTDFTPYISINGLGDMARMDTGMTNIVLETVYINYFIRLIAAKRSPATDAKYKQALMDFDSAIMKRIDTAPTL